MPIKTAKSLCFAEGQGMFTPYGPYLWHILGHIFCFLGGGGWGLSKLFSAIIDGRPLHSRSPLEGGSSGVGEVALPMRCWSRIDLCSLVGWIGSTANTRKLVPRGFVWLCGAYHSIRVHYRYFAWGKLIPITDTKSCCQRNWLPYSETYLWEYRQKSLIADTDSLLNSNHFPLQI